MKHENSSETMTKTHPYVTNWMVNRKFKDSLFRMLMNDREALLSLYNALNRTQYDNPEELEITTLENAVYMAMKNDVSCVFHSELYLFEHQSTVNPNMPLRDLFYVAQQLQSLTVNRSVYNSTLIRIPAPRFYVFYNGTEEQPEHLVLKLSESFTKKEDEPQLELLVHQLNINRENNQVLKKACRTLGEYMVYVEKVRQYAGELPLEEAVDCAIRDCIREDVLKEFLIKHRSEARSMSIFEYDYELHMRELEQEGEERGIKIGEERGIKVGKELGTEECLLELVKEGSITPELAAKKLGITKEEVIQKTQEN